MIVHNSPTLKKMGLYWVWLSVIPSVQLFASVQLSLSAQYLENKLTEFYQILFIQSYWQDLAWDCYTSFLHNELWLLIYTKISFPLNLENKLTEFHQIIYMWPVTRKGTSWVSYSEVHFFRFLNREFYDESRNLTCWWVLDNFGSQNVQRRWVPP